MQPIHYLLWSMGLYAVQNVVFEAKFSHLHPAGLLICFYCMMLPLAVGRYVLARPVEGVTMFPTGPMLALALVVGIGYFFADYCYMAAYASGGTLLMVTTMSMLIPVCASVLKFAWTRASPSTTQVVGYAFAAFGVYLVTRSPVNP